RVPTADAGTPSAARMPAATTAADSAPESGPDRSTRAGLPVSWTSVVTLRPPRENRLPIGVGGGPVRAHAPRTVTPPSGRYRSRGVKSTPSRWPTSPVTGANASLGPAARGDRGAPAP